MTARTLQRSPCRQLGSLLLALLAAACLRLPLVDAVTRLKHAQSLVSRLSSTHWTDKTESLELCPTSPGGNTWTSLDPAALPGSVAVAGKTFFLLSGGGGAAKACQRDSATRQLNAASVLTAFKIKPLHRHSQILVLCVLPRRAAALLTRSSSLSSADAVGLELGRGQAGRTDTAGGDAAPRGKRLDGHEAQAPAAPTASGDGWPRSRRTSPSASPRRSDDDALRKENLLRPIYTYHCRAIKHSSGGSSADKREKKQRRARRQKAAEKKRAAALSIALYILF